MGFQIFVKNDSKQSIDCFVSKWTNGSGDDNWFPLAPGRADIWGRNDGWELVAFKDGNNNRAGRYIRTGSAVIFRSLDNIEVQ